MCQLLKCLVQVDLYQEVEGVQQLKVQLSSAGKQERRRIRNYIGAKSEHNGRRGSNKPLDRREPNCTGDGALCAVVSCVY